MFVCEICNKKADIHHIVHRSEGGFDIPLNYKYLCPVHHRGRLGPHHNLEIDIQYKLELQNKLYKLLRKDYYSSKQLSLTLNQNLFHQNVLRICFAQRKLIAAYSYF